MQSFKKLARMLLLAALINTAHAASPLDDATIFAIFDEANTTDVWVGRIAVKQAHSEAVRELGKMVVSDHEAVQQSWRGLAKKLGIIPTPPSADGSAANLAKAVTLLQSKSGAAFDKAYLQHEIAFHQTVIDTVKNGLLPAIKNEEFKEQVIQALPAFEHHLAETKAVAKKLGIEK